MFGIKLSGKDSMFKEIIPINKDIVGIATKMKFGIVQTFLLMFMLHLLIVEFF